MLAATALRALRPAAAAAAGPGLRAMSVTPMDKLFNPTEEHAALRASVRDFVANEVEPQAAAFNEREEFNVGLFHQLGELGAMGCTVPEEYGGLGMDAAASCAIMEELSYSDPAFCLSYLASSLLCHNNIAVNASHEQKLKYLPAACEGSAPAGFMAMSEPSAGTDVMSMSTRATRDGDNWRLNGTKTWITTAYLADGKLADHGLVYAKTDKGLSLFIVETADAGFSATPIKQKLGMRASPTAELSLDDVLVPGENLVGTEGKAPLSMHRNLEIERLGLAAMSVGIARRCLDVMNDYANERMAFGTKISKLGQVQAHIGKAYAGYRAGKAYVYAVANALDLTQPGNRLDSDGVKLFCAPMATQVAESAIQVLGGNGYIGAYNVERLWRDAKLLQIGGGTDEAHTKNITADLARVEGGLE